MKWSESLVKATINDFIFDVRFAPGEEAPFAALRALSAGRVDTRDRLNEIKAALKALPPARQLSAAAREVVGSVKEELAEIASDLRFAKSRRGKYVLFIQDYVQHVYATVRQDRRFADVMIGGHAEKEVVLVAGRVDSEADLESLRAVLADMPSGLPEEYRVLIKTKV